MFDYFKGQVKNLHNVSELYADDPEEGMRQVRMLLTSTQQRANQFETEHCGDNTSAAKNERPVRRVLNMQQQLYGNKPDTDLLT
jgi:hypothetical protein